MTTGRNPKLCVPFGLLLLSASLLLCTGTVRGAPSIDVQIGFNGNVVPERYAPVRIRVRDYVGPAAVRFRVTQTLGSSWRGTATVSQEPPLNITSDGVYHTTVPIYDPLNPIVVSLVDGRGNVLTEQEVDLRSTRHLEPFPVVYGMLPYPLGEEKVPVNAVELPTDWWAYDSAHSLWISSAPPRESWDAIARWIFAGGTVVLLSGPDYYRYDSPIVREILPVTDPTLVTGSAGEEFLNGTARPATQTVLRRDGEPLLLVRPYGAGHVALVTVKASDVTRSETELIVDSVPASSRIVLSDFSETALGTLPAVRPSYLAAILLAVTAVGGFAVSVAVARRRHHKRAVVSVLVLFGLLTVLSGLYANEGKSVIEEYYINTRLQAYTWFGIYIDTASFLWTKTGRLTHPSPGETVPMQIVSASAETEPLYALMPQSQVFPATFEHSFLGGQVSAPMRSGIHKTFSSYGVSPPLLHLAYDAGSDLLVLEQGSEAGIDDAWFILDGFGFHVTSVPRGTSSYPLDDLHSVRELTAAVSDPSVAVLRSMSDVFPFGRGVWFVGQSAGWSEPDDPEGRKVRLLTVYVVEGERND